MSDFAYLHIHTHFSRAGGPASPSSWCVRARELGYTSIGITDRSPLSGWPAMHRAACQSGLGLIYGMEADLALPPDSNRKGKAPPDPAIQGALLLAHSPEGALNIAQLASVAYAGWPAHESPIPWDALAAHAQGLFLILLGGDEGGALQPIIGGDDRKAEAWATALKSAFNASIYVGLPHSGRAGDIALGEAIASRAGVLGLSLVALPAARYLQPGDAPVYEALKIARMRAGWPRESAASSSIASDRAGYDYLRSPEEALALYNRWPEAIQNTTLIANQAAQHDRWPFDVPDPKQGRAILLATAERQLQHLLGVDALPPEAHDRLASEISATGDWGSAGAWTALAALASHAQDSQEPVPYQAQTPNSLLAYALSISRSSPTEPQSPDEQLAIAPLPAIVLPSSGRAALLNRLAEEYGQDRVAHAACALDITPMQALAASANVLGLESDLLRGLISPIMDQGWHAIKNLSGDGPASNVAAIALSLKGAPLALVPDHDTALVAPRAVYGSFSLASWSPILRPVDSPSPSTVHRPPSVPWPAESLAHLGYPAIHLPSSAELDALHAALQLALRYPLPGLDLPPAASEPDKFLAALKSQHPSSYFAGLLGAAWRRGSAAAVTPLADEARKLGVKLEPPHVNFSLEYPTIQRDGEAWSVLWGLATLPGWSTASAASFVSGRPSEGFTSLAGVVEAAFSSGLGIPQLSTLIMAGACDTLGARPRDRHALLSALPALFEWAATRVKPRGTSSIDQLDLFSAPTTPPPLEDDLQEDNSQTSFQVARVSRSPHERYLRRQWERENLGVAFTEADAIDMLNSALEASGGLRSRLTSIHDVSLEQLGTTLHIVGLLCEITLLQAEDGATLAVGTLHDPHGTLELVAFPPNYKRHATLWIENNLVAVTARVQAHQDGVLYLLCEHLAPFTAAVSEESYSITIKTRAAKAPAAAPKETSQPARSDLRILATPPPDTQRAPQPSMPAQPPAFTLIISIPDADEDQTVIDSVIGLKRLLEEYPGADTVTIRVPYIRGKWTSASLSWGVRYSHQLESRIRRLLGDDAIAVIQLAS